MVMDPDQRILLYGSGSTSPVETCYWSDLMLNAQLGFPTVYEYLIPLIVNHMSSLGSGVPCSALFRENSSVIFLR